MKKCITSLPILARFDPTKTVFFKTDWSTEGTTWIRVQPTDDEELNKAAKNLIATGEWGLDLEKNGARLWPVSYGYCSCTDTENKFHPF